MSWIKDEPVPRESKAWGRRRAEGDPGPQLDRAKKLKIGPGDVRPLSPGRSEPQRSRSGPGPSEGGGEWKLTLGRTALIAWVGLILAGMVWVFFLGVMVGRGDVFKNRAFERITERLPLENQAPPPVVEVEPETEEAELTFYRDLAQPSPEPKRALEGPLTVVDPPKPPVSDVGRRTGPAAESTGESLEKEPEPAAPETESAAGSEAEPSTPTKRPQSTSGVKTVEPDQSAQPPPKIQPGQNYTVQVAASSDADDAGRVVDKLKAQGFDDAYYYQVELNGRRYFRVRVGRYATRAEAEKTMNRLAEAGRSNMFISALTQ